MEVSGSRYVTSIYYSPPPSVARIEGNGLHGRRGVERVWWFFFVAVQHDEEEDYDYSDDEGYDDHLWHCDDHDDADGDDGDVGHGDYDKGNGNDDIGQWWWRVDVSTTISGRTTSTDFSIFSHPTGSFESFTWIIIHIDDTQKKFQVKSKKSPTGPTKRTPKPEYLVARLQPTERGPLG